jgi:hypothetical protein
MLLSELQGHMTGARGSGPNAAKLRASTALDNPGLSRSGLQRNFPQLPAHQRSTLLKWRKEQDDTLRQIRQTMRTAPPESGLLSSMEHLARNYQLRLPDRFSPLTAQRQLP